MRMDGSREKILGTVHASDIVTWVSGKLCVASSWSGRGWDGGRGAQFPSGGKTGYGEWQRQGDPRRCNPGMGR